MQNRLRGILGLRELSVQAAGSNLSRFFA